MKKGLLNFTLNIIFLITFFVLNMDIFITVHAESPSSEKSLQSANVMKQGMDSFRSDAFEKGIIQEAPSPEKSSQSIDFMKQGLDSFRRGAFEEAILLWNQTVQSFDNEGNPKEKIEVLIQLSRAYQFIGQYRAALKTLKTSLAIAEQSGDKSQLASVMSNIGSLLIATGEESEAYRYLNEGLSIAREMGISGLEALILNNIGNLYSSQEKYDKALDAYLKSIIIADIIDNHNLVPGVRINAAKAYIKRGKYEEAKAQLDTALNAIQAMDDSHDKAYALINIGLSYIDLRPDIQGPHNLLTRLAYKALKEAGTVAESLDNPRASSYAWGNLGALYEDEKRYEESLTLTHRAAFAAQQANAPESLYRWQWQSGRLLMALGKLDEAISAYRQAVHTLQSIRHEMAAGYGASLSAFRTSLGPIYLELVDLLLKRAAMLENQEQYEPFLLEAREVVELLKAAELRDYFRDDCVDDARIETTRLDLISRTAVVVYLVPLPDRTELLVNLPTGMKRYAVNVSSHTLTQEVRKFRLKLEKRTTSEYRVHAQTLYDWLIRPLERDLKSFPVDTLVFVPDGPLRTIPMAALHDGKEFLISQYAIAVTPGLNLTNPQPLKRNNIRLLAVGLSSAVQDFPPLPHVDGELQAIHDMYGGGVLLNRDFLLSNMEKSLMADQYSVVHIASHGKFESSVEKSFILTFDDKLTLDRLDQLVGRFKSGDDPMELLMLSACESAAGDDRAALGLAGVAIKAGARSAIATLWYINDKASALLVKEFYRQLSDPSVSRAVALQRAQLNMLNNFNYQHPGYWSPFLLINNWL